MSDSLIQKYIKEDDIDNIITYFKDNINMNEILVDTLYHYIDTDTDEYLIKILDSQIDNIDFYHLLYLSLIRCILHNSMDCLKKILSTYKLFITENLKNSVAINLIKNYPLFKIINIIKYLGIKSINEYLFDLILKNKMSPKSVLIIPELISIITFNIESIKITPIVKQFINKNPTFKNIILKKVDNSSNKSLNPSWKTYCNIFDKLNYSDLILFLNTKGITDYNNTCLSKYNHRQLCFLLRTNKIIL